MKILSMGFFKYIPIYSDSFKANLPNLRYFFFIFKKKPLAFFNNSLVLFKYL